MRKLQISTELRSQKSDLFATYDTIDEILDRIPDGAQTALVIGITLNTVLELLAQSFEEKGL